MKVARYLKETFFYKYYKRMRYVFVGKFPLQYTKIQYKKYYGTKLNIDNPILLSEKIQYLKLITYPSSQKVIEAADKYTIHDYLDNKGLSAYSVPYLFIYAENQEVNLDELPRSFVLKKTNASGLNLLVKDKKNITQKELNEILHRWSKTDYGKIGGEFHYSASKSRIICENYFDLGDEYRFFMVGGKLAFIQVIVWDWDIDESGHQNNDATVIAGHKKHYRFHFDIEDNLILQDKDATRYVFKKPNYWEELIKVSESIGKDFPVVRVDFNDIQGVPKITELTFTPAGGFLEILRQKPNLDKELGVWINKLEV